MKQSQSETKSIHKPTPWTSKFLSFFGFINPEDLMYALVKNEFQFMNYGMSPTKPNTHLGVREEAVNYLELMDMAGEKARKCDQMLEIGCGLGYGAQIVYEHFKPKKLLAIDRAQQAVKFAQQRFENTGVTYKYQDFKPHISPKNTFDVIYTVESGGRFPGLENFEWLQQLLKPGGLFLMASINPLEEIERKKQFAEHVGLTLVAERDVTENVITYLGSEKKSRQVDEALLKMPDYKSVWANLFKGLLKEFTRLPGSKAFEALGSTEFYYHLAFRK
jgi:protein-L-isoaspartate O-methyltransferase